MTKDQLDAIRERLEKAQPPIWLKIDSLSIQHEWLGDEYGGRRSTGYCPDNAAFIIAAHNYDIPDLLALVDEQAKTIATLEQVIHDIDIGGEANYGAEQERRAIIEFLDGYRRHYSTVSDANALFAVVINGIINGISARGPTPQDMPPPARLRERVTQLETALRQVYSQVRYHSSGYAREVSIIAEKALESKP